jgi:hypothetical protein
MVPTGRPPGDEEPGMELVSIGEFPRRSGLSPRAGTWPATSSAA